MDALLLSRWSELLVSPLFEPLHPVLERLGRDHFPALGDLNALLAARPDIAVQSGKLLCFVGQGLGEPGSGARYEPRCYLNGEVQTRENNLHDLFNALVWLTFPQSKAAINARHYRALTDAIPVSQTRRGGVRDTATLFDESGVIVACANTRLAGLLCDFKWKELFWSHRDEVSAAMGFYIFGHGLYEKAMRPYIGMTGQGLVLDVAAEFFTWPTARRLQHLDARVAAYLNGVSNCGDTRELTPVPLLGVPDWSEDSVHEAYYDNRDYFRPGRRSALGDGTASMIKASASCSP